MNVVFVCQQNPWRLNGGALIRNYWLIRALAREHSVHLVTADDAAEAIPAEFAASLASLERFPRARGLGWKVRRALGAMRTNASYYTSGAVSAALSSAVRRLAREPRTVVMLDLPFFDAVAGLKNPLIYNAHNAESDLLLRRADLESGANRSFMRLDAQRVARIEADLVRRASLVAGCSEDDRRDLLRLVPDAAGRIAVVPNGVDTAHYAHVAASEPETSRILVTGSFDWRPNRAALDWFVEAVLPELRAELGDVLDVGIAGRMDDLLATKLNGLANVTAIARPPDMRDELARARVVIAPVLASSGTRLRILEAWAAGKPVATTSAGAFGLNYANERELLVADAAPDLAHAAARLVREPAVWRAVRTAALARVREYDWSTIADGFLDDVRLAVA